MSRLTKLISIDKLRQIIFSVLGYDDFNLIRSNNLYDRILFNYGYYANGVTVKRIKGCLFHYNMICGLGNNKFQEGGNYKYRIKAKEINSIIKLLKEIEDETRN
jgi:hypothetical protein